MFVPLEQKATEFLVFLNEKASLSASFFSIITPIAKSEEKTLFLFCKNKAIFPAKRKTAIGSHSFDPMAVLY